MRLFSLIAFAALCLAGCDTHTPPLEMADAPKDSIRQLDDLSLPVAHSNNAVAIIESMAGPTLYSFNGLRSGKDWQHTSNQAFACDAQQGCRDLPALPVAEGRLASAALAMADGVYVFGGYTVAEDGGEVSTPEVLYFDPGNETWARKADMPLPVDDMVIFAYQGRYIYLVSGWHDTGNVSDVQVYDTQTDSWARATDYPGSPVFGHAGGAAGDTILIADGVAVIGEVDGKRQFGLVDEVWLGRIDPANHLNITWQQQAAHPGPPLYRMASAGDPALGSIVFAGGGDNAYNFDGIGYDGVPAEATDAVFAWHVERGEWESLPPMPQPSMDHRGLLILSDGRYAVAGGMDAGRNVTGRIMIFGDP